MTKHESALRHACVMVVLSFSLMSITTAGLAQSPVIEIFIAGAPVVAGQAEPGSGPITVYNTSYDAWAPIGLSLVMLVPVTSVSAPGFDSQGLVTPGNPAFVALPISLMNTGAGSTILDRGIHVTSDEPISVLFYYLTPSISDIYDLALDRPSRSRHYGRRPGRRCRWACRCRSRCRLPRGGRQHPG